MSGSQELPVTGSSSLVIGLIGAALAAVGAVLTFGARLGARARTNLR